MPRGALRTDQIRRDDGLAVAGSSACRAPSPAATIAARRVMPMPSCLVAINSVKALRGVASSLG